MAWIIDAEVNFEGQQSSNNFEIEADTAEEALQQAKERLERNGATVLKIEAKMLQ